MVTFSKMCLIRFRAQNFKKLHSGVVDYFYSKETWRLLGIFVGLKPSENVAPIAIFDEMFGKSSRLKRVLSFLQCLMNLHVRRCVLEVT